MVSVKGSLRVVEGGGGPARKSPLEAGYEHFRLDRMGNRASANTLAHYDYMVRPFLAWAEEEGIRRFEDLGVERLRHYRALVASRPLASGRLLEGRSVLDSHKALMTFVRWAADEEYEVDRRIFTLSRRRPILGTVLAVSVAVGLGLEDVIVFDADPRESNRSAARCPL